MSDNHKLSRGQGVLGQRKAVGNVVTINSQSIRVYDRDENGNVLRCSGTVTVTDAGSGYAKGCMYIKTDVSTGTSGLYQNVGTSSSCLFRLMEGVEGVISGVTAGTGLSGGGTEGTVTLNATTNLQTNMVQAAIGGFNATEQKYLFSAPSSCQVTNVILLSDTATASSDGSNNFTFQVQNLTDAEALLSAVVTTDSNEIVADAAYQITPDQNNNLDQGDVLELQITKTGTPTDLSSAEVVAFVSYTAA